MTSPSELVAQCIVSGFLPEYLEAEASLAFAQAYEKKGEEKVIEKISERMARSPIRSMKLLNMVLSDIPDKPKEEPAKAEDDRPKSISDEVAEEELDFREQTLRMKEMPEVYGTWTKPNDPRFDQHPSIFDGPYKGHEEYKANTYIAVRKEAYDEGTSMHEICRRKGLEYDRLIF